MRSKKQVAMWMKRGKIANEMLLWIKQEGKAETFPSYPLVDEFARLSGYHIFECWHAFELLQKAGKLPKPFRSGWKVLDFTPISIDDNGDVEVD